MYKKSRSEGFGPEVKRRIMLGSFVLSSGYYDAYYLKALRTKALIKQEFDRAFEKYDMILSPAAPSTAPRLGESLSDPLQMYLGDIYTVSVNLAGLPGITVPCGMDDKGLPIGMQLIGDCFSEKKLFRAAYTYEQTGQVWVFGAPPNAVEQPQKIFVLVASSTCTSSPMTVSYCFDIVLLPPYRFSGCPNAPVCRDPFRY